MVVVTLSLCYLAPDGTERRVSNWKSILDNTAIGSRVARCFFMPKIQIWVYFGRNWIGKGWYI
jgi:hypothetical protein